MRMWESLPATGNCNNVYNKPTDLHIRTYVRGAKGGCFGGAVGAKTKSFSIERPVSPTTAEKRLLPGPHGPNWRR